MPGTDARRRLALIAIGLFLTAAPAAHAATGDLDLVSRANGAGGTSGNGGSTRPDVSRDGHLVAFVSGARNLTGDPVPAGVTEAYVRNLATNATVLISQDGGTPSPTNVAQTAISDDGHYAVYAVQSGVYLRDLQANRTTLVRANAVDADLSADGSTVAFRSNENIPGTGATGASPKVYAYDVATGDYELVSRQDGLGGATMTGDTPSLSDDGNVVAFQGQGAQVFVRDRGAGSTVLASRASGVAGQQASSAATQPDLSGDGRYVVFSSAAPNLTDGDVNGKQDVFERDLAGATTTLVSRATGATGAAGDQNSDRPAVSDDGERVLFVSRATGFAAGAPTGGDSGYVRDTQTGTTTWVTQAADGTGPQGTIGGLDMSGDGEYAGFDYSVALLGAQETGSFADVYRRDLGAEPAPPAPPVASIGADQSLAEGDFGTSTPATFTVTLSHGDPRPITIDWATFDGSATQGSDYRAATGQVTFAPGQTTADLSADVLGDNTDEPDETFSIRLSNPVNATLGRATATVTIRDDDLPPPVVGPPLVAAPPAALPAHSGRPATTCATQVTQGLAVLRGCFSNGKATGVVSLNGLTVDLGANQLVVDAAKISSTGPVTVSAGDVVLQRGAVLGVDPKTGAGILNAPSDSGVYGLGLEPRLALALAPGGVATVSGYATLPVLNAQVKLQFATSDADGLRRESLVASRDLLELRGTLASAVRFTFDPAAQLWRGGLSIQYGLPGLPTFKFGGTIARSGAITLTGTLPPGKTTRYFTLHAATLTFVPNPLGISGHLAFDAGPADLLSFDGSLKYTFGSGLPSLAGTVKVFGLPLGTPQLGGILSFISPLATKLPGLAGTASGTVLGGTLPLAFGSAPGGQPPAGPPAPQYGDFLGGSVGGVIPQLGAFLDPITGGFLAYGDGKFKVLGVTIDGDAAANSTGFAACGQIGFLHFGLGVRWSPFSLTAMGPATCDVGPWRASASAAQAGRLTLPAGVQVLRLHGTGPATLHGPGGQTISTATAPQVGATAIVLKDQHYTYVALKRPKGAWTLDGVSGVDSAAQLAPPKVTAKVSGRRIRWTAKVAAGETVTLAEQGTGVYHELGRLHGRRGTLRFSPAAGGGRRTLEAVVTQAGLPVSRLVVARFTAPRPAKPGRPGKVTVEFSGKRLAVAWKAARHATGYLVAARTPNGTLLAMAKRPRATLTDILPVTRATVTVTPLGAAGARGPARTVSARPRR